MNPLVKFFNELHPDPENKDYVLQSEMSEEEFSSKMERIQEAVTNATEEERIEFLEWNQNPPPLDWKEKAINKSVTVIKNAEARARRAL